MVKLHLLLVSFRSSLFLCLLAPVLLTGCGGCHESTTPKPDQSNAKAEAEQYREELFTYAIANLNRLEEFSSAEAIRKNLERFDPRNQPKLGQTDTPIDPLVAAWPEPKMFRQIIDRLNQWLHAQTPPPDWKLDPMVASLPRELLELPQMKNLDQMRLSRFDGHALQEAVWFRDVSLWARGNVLDDLEQAQSLFDWMVRNIQLEADDPKRIPLFPWETLLFGRGTAAERSEVFILLVRQLGLDAAMLAVEAEPQADEDGQKTLRPWCVGVLIEGDVYLFDPVLGLPIPGPNGAVIKEGGRLSINPATLAQAATDAKLLRYLDVGDTHVYGIEEADLAHVVAFVEASPPNLSRSMELLESRLAGKQRMVLTTSPTAQSEHWKAAAHIAETRLWTRPFETIRRRSKLTPEEVRARLIAMLPFYIIPSAPLYHGRMLQIKGQFIGQDGATRYYQMARPSNQELKASSAHPLEKIMSLRGKQDASYWSGLIAYQRENYSAAIDYFTQRTLLAYPNGPWTNGARYNLARAYEASGQTERAILQYGSNAASPGYHGSLLRAKWLGELSEK